MIKWIFGIAVLALIIVSPRFRKFALIFLLIASIIGVALWQYQEYERNKSKNSIHPSELVLQNMEFKPLDTDYEFEMSGRIINNSEKYTLKSIVLTITTQECGDSSQADCLIVSEQQESSISQYLRIKRGILRKLFTYILIKISKRTLFGGIRFAMQFPNEYMMIQSSQSNHN